MTVPDFESLMVPVLEFLADGQVYPRRDVAAAMIDHFQLSDEDVKATIPSGGKVINNRTWWATTHLFQAGLLARPQRGHVQITTAGRELLAEHPAKITVKLLLSRYPSYVEFRSRKSAGKPDKPDDGAEGSSDQSPQDLLQQAVVENRAVVTSELLLKLRAMDPTDFEKLVIRLLNAMGYGTSGSLEHTPKSGDAGIDGIISQDPLGLDRIYLQAKRYAVDNVVQRPAIQSFVGALIGAQGDRGVFITTSSFSSGAITEASRVNMRVELIDGERLASLMVDFGVGVQPEAIVTLHRVDEDFFEGM